MDLLADYTLRVVAVGAGVLGAACGALGSFAVLRRQSLLGDALSHAALPGIALAFLITGTKEPLALMLGAGIVGWLGTRAVAAVVKRSRVPYDAALGMMLAVFFGFGLVLLTLIQKLPRAAQAGLESYLFGQAAALLKRDVILTAILGAAAVLILAAGWKQFKLLSFDPDFAASLGVRVTIVDTLLTTLLVVAVVIGLQTVGVVLMSAMIVAPAAAARQWTERLGAMVCIAAFFGAVAGIVGALLSSAVANLPTGPTIVLVLSVLVAVSVVFAPRRGLLWRRLRLGQLAESQLLDPVLMHLYALSLQHEDDPEHGHSVAVLRTMSQAGTDLPAALDGLEQRGLARRVGADDWAPTAIGRREAHRIWQRQEETGT